MSKRVTRGMGSNTEPCRFGAAGLAAFDARFSLAKVCVPYSIESLATTDSGGTCCATCFTG